MKTSLSAVEVRIYDRNDPKLWNDMVSQLPFSHVLQSYQWGLFKSRHGWTAHPFFFEAEGVVKGTALVLRRRLPGLPWGLMYVPKGPALDYSDLRLLEAVLFHLEDLARQRKALLIKIDPDVSYEDEALHWTLLQRRVIAPAHTVPQSSSVVDTLLHRRWRLSSEQVQFRNTLLVDLGQSEEALLAQMKSKTRYNIRLADRKGIRVRLGGQDDLPTFYQLYAETSRRNNFIIRPYDYYYDVWLTFLQDDLADLLLADWEGRTIAGLLLFRLGHKAWYMYGASSSEHRDLMPNHLLQWEAMRLAKQKGCLLYDLWGAPDDMANEQDPMAGVYRFKAGLGGQVARHIGAYDFATNPILTPLCMWALPRYIRLLHSKHKLFSPAS